MNSLDEIAHLLVREVAKLLGIDVGLEISHSADLPARSGLVKLNIYGRSFSCATCLQNRGH